jgi:hypothetical protein
VSLHRQWLAITASKYGLDYGVGRTTQIQSNVRSRVRWSHDAQISGGSPTSRWVESRAGAVAYRFNPDEPCGVEALVDRLILLVGQNTSCEVVTSPSVRSTVAAR